MSSETKNEEKVEHKPPQVEEDFTKLCGVSEDGVYEYQISVPVT